MWTTRLAFRPGIFSFTRCVFQHLCNLLTLYSQLCQFWEDWVSVCTSFLFCLGGSIHPSPHPSDPLVWGTAFIERLFCCVTPCLLAKISGDLLSYSGPRVYQKNPNLFEGFKLLVVVVVSIPLFCWEVLDHWLLCPYVMLHSAYCIVIPI